MVSVLSSRLEGRSIDNNDNENNETGETEEIYME